MRILKYIFFLLLLSLVGLTVFIATQKGSFDIQRSQLIKTPKKTVADYIKDYRNWETFGTWLQEDKNTVFDYPENTSGLGGSFSWKNTNGEGKMKTLFVKENDSIVQKMILNGMESKIYWTFKDTVGGTKVSWRSIGEMNLLFKAKSVLRGGINSLLGNMFETSLYNLDKTLDYELKTYKIKVGDIVEKKGKYFLKQSVRCKNSSVLKNIRIILPRMIYFFKKNNIQINGNPFVIYDKIDQQNEIVTISVCIPIKNKVNIMPGSDVTFGEISDFSALKTTLYGDYSHLSKAKAKAKEYINKNNITIDPSGYYIDEYTKYYEQVKNPSQWITQIYTPVIPKVIVKRKEIDSTNIQKDLIPAPTTEATPTGNIKTEKTSSEKTEKRVKIKPISPIIKDQTKKESPEIKTSITPKVETKSSPNIKEAIKQTVPKTPEKQIPSTITKDKEQKSEQKSEPITTPQSNKN